MRRHFARRRVLYGALAVLFIALVAVSGLLMREHVVKKHKGIAKALGLLALSSGHGIPAMAVAPTTVGINLGKTVYFVRSRAFANLVRGGTWQSRIPDYKQLGPEFVDKDGNVKSLPGGQPLWRLLSRPNASETEATIRCTYQGKGQLEPGLGAVQQVQFENGGFTFHWSGDNRAEGKVQLKLSSVDPSDPIRSIDCRETTLPSSARFDPEYLAYLRGFKILRFMDWQNTNGNLPISWATRHTSASQDIVKGDGIPIEDMIELANQIGADPWFCMPWNADDDYIRRFAQLVHDRLPAGHRVYVDLANEVWNLAFPVSRQARQEGVAEGLAPDPNTALLFRYAERTAHVMDIWAKVFADRPDRLVRVAACQNGPGCLQRVLGFRDTAAHVDAAATAPYFGHAFTKDPPASVDEAYARMDGMIDEALGKALAAKAVAARYGKRYIAYEAGQHVVLKDVDLSQKIQRDPRMYEAYKQYLGLWRAKIGDVLTLYSSISPVSKFGSWGLSEYLGQPVTEAPKLRAVREFMGSKGEPAR